MNPFGSRPRLLATVLLIVAVAVGLLGGIALERGVLHPRGMATWGGHHHHRPGGLRWRFERQLTKELDLSPEQRRRVDSLLEAHENHSRALMRGVAPQLREVAGRAEAGLREILTPEQFRRFEELRKERLEDWREKYRRRAD